MSLFGLHLAACWVLLAAGAAKLGATDALANGLRGVLPVSTRGARGVVRALAAAELVVGGLAAVTPTRWTAAMLAVSYSAFALFVMWLRSRGAAVSSCGCFGQPDTPATPLHVGITVAFAAAGWAVAATAPTGGLGGVLATQPGNGAPLLLTSAAVALLAIAGLTEHASLQASRALYREP